MDKILITGGTGTVGTAFIKKYRHKFKFATLSRNENSISNLYRKFPEVKTYIGNVSNMSDLMLAYSTFKPDIVIHAAAMKHINLAEKSPASAIENNLLGTMNVITMSKLFEVPITVGISSDKACNTSSVYGMTKKLMEKLFFEAHTVENKFICTRFANVAGSNGSVIPLFLDKVKRGDTLTVTDKNMNRLMITQNDASELIYKALSLCNHCTTPLIVCKLSKSVNIDLLARSMSNNVKYVGFREGESLNEILIRKDELPYAFIVGDNEIVCLSSTLLPLKVQASALGLQYEYSSASAAKMSQHEINELIAQCN